MMDASCFDPRRPPTDWDARHGRFPPGWGATFLPLTDLRLLLARGFFNRASLHINVHELEVVKRVILSFSPTSGRRPTSLCQTSWAHVQLKVDDQVVMYYLWSLCSPFLALMKEIRALFYLLESQRTILKQNTFAQRTTLFWTACPGKPTMMTRHCTRDCTAASNITLVLALWTVWPRPAIPNASSITV